ncbi:MAG: helicase-exonuclease AddAB subunit AddB [Ignavibacteriales bacterium]
MSLRFIIGRAGYGKTTRCLNEINQELLQSPKGSALILLVPEQGTFEMEKALVSLAGLEGTIRANVLSFRRLAWRVLNEVGGAARPHLQETGRRMIIRNILEQKRSDLQVFSRSANQPGFADKLALAIGEMKSYCILPGQLMDSSLTVKADNSLLGDKLHDLALIYDALTQALEGHFTDPDDYLILAAHRLAKFATCQGATVWVDGFTDFTPQEILVLKQLLITCHQVNVTLCLDSETIHGSMDEQSLFYRSHRTYRRMLDIAHDMGISLDPTLALGQGDADRFTGHPGLAHMERGFFVRPRQPWKTECPEIKLVAAHNRRAEVEGAAREILALARDHGYHWRDISILVRDLSHYGDLIEKVFDDLDIPCFIDYKRPVMNHPLIELMLSALAVVNSRWAYAPVFRCLKTDFLGVSREEVDELENYVLAHSIKGGRWTDDKPWQYRRFYSIGEDEEIDERETARLDRINDIRYRAVAELAVFESRVKANPGVRGTCAALYQLLEDLQVQAALEKWTDEARTSGDLAASREHAQIYDQVLALLDDMVEAFGEEVLLAETYGKVLESGLESLRLGLIPPGLDQVFVGSLDRSRNPAVRANFLIGVNDGVLPGRLSGHGIFTDMERTVLSDEGLELAPDMIRSLFHEQFLIYQGLTRSAENLWISYALADVEGNSLNPSVLISDIKELYPHLKETICPLEPAGNEEGLEFVARKGQSMSCLVARLREIRSGQEDINLWGDVYNWFLSSNPDQLNLLSGLFYTNQETMISSISTGSLYGSSLRVSVTQIEKYISCPFSHFVQYGLRVRERETGKVRPLDMGQFFHAALKLLVERIIQQDMEWDKITPEICEQMVDDIFESLVPQLQNEIIMSSERQKYLVGKLRQIVLSSALAIVDHMRVGNFRPIGLEVPFGYPGGWKGQEFKLEDGTLLALAGRIDRIDGLAKDNEQYIRLIDYKSGATALDLNDLYYGLRIQLLTYLDAILVNLDKPSDSQAVPGAMLYFHIQNPVLSAGGAMNPEDIARNLRKSYKLKGLVLGEPEVIEMMETGLIGNSEVIPVAINQDGGFRSTSSVASRDQFAVLREHLHRIIGETGQSMIKGQVPIRPYRRNKRQACTYCKYKPICRFELMTNNQYRDLKNQPADFIWQAMEKGGKDNG